MNWLALLGVLLVAYAVFVFYVSFAKPEKIWEMGKVKGFRKVLGEGGTTALFIVFGLAMGVLGIWLMV
ncbi:MAG TPA: hypothetical protein PKE04_01795 [Clostridia bacterium]|nr:hypothetical protein [Clostridia bacterium]